jgi:hypothetical protein
LGGTLPETTGMIRKMNIIAIGWQYTVYDKGNGKVVKHFHSFLFAAVIMTKDILVDLLRLRRHSLFDILPLLKEMRELATHSIEGIRSHPEIPPRFFGNPIFIPGTLDYEQDKVKTFRSYFNSCQSTELKKRLIEKLVRFCRDLATLGIVEKSFNIGSNFGVDPEEDIMLIDLGEIIFDPLLSKIQIQKRPWANQGNLSFFSEHELRAHFVQCMDESFADVTSL